MVEGGGDLVKIHLVHGANEGLSDGEERGGHGGRLVAVVVRSEGGEMVVGGRGGRTTGTATSGFCFQASKQRKNVSRQSISAR